MEIAQQARLETAERGVRGHDVTILFGYSFFAIVLLLGIYFGSMSSGTALGDLASMTVLP
jgi:GNAT superfamily N-acetyltransferase